MAQIKEDLYMIIVDVIKEQGCSIYHLERKGNRLEIFVDRKGGAKLGDCEVISKSLSLRLAAMGDDARSLVLDVSTPGIERRLYTPEHFRSAKGERVKVKITGEVIEGVLAEVSEEDFLLETKDGASRRFRYNEILTARVQRSTEELFKRR